MNMFHGWLPLYNKNEELASIKETSLFISEVTGFVKAQWSTQFLENGHCFYEGGQLADKIIWAHDAWRPGSSTTWSWVLSNSLAECRQSYSTQCLFWNRRFSTYLYILNANHPKTIVTHGYQTKLPTENVDNSLLNESRTNT